MKRKLVSAAEAVALIRPGDTITTSGFVGNGVPEHLLAALEARFLDEGTPDGLGLFLRPGRATARTGD